MGEIGRLYGIIFRMRGEGVGRHHEPHIHVIYNEHSASYSLDGRLLAGELPQKQERVVLEKLEEYKEELLEQYRHIENGERVERIF